jgi:hypothetical protein
MHQDLLIEWRPTGGRYGGCVPEHEDNATTDVAAARVTAGARTSVYQRMGRSSGGVMAVIQTIIGVAFLVLFASIFIRIIW